MTPVIPSTVSSISFVPVNAFSSRKNRCFSRFSYYGNSTKEALSSQRLFTTLPRIPIVFPQLRNGSSSHQTIRKVSATDTDGAGEEKDSAVENEAKEELSTKPDIGTDGTRARRRQGRKSEMPPVKDEDLVPGAIFNGKVRSIQPFGAFVDFGAFADGLVHVSRLSDNFVKDVNDVVSLGQEVKVRVVEVNTETGRISLSMREDDSSNKPQQKKDANNDTTRSPKRSPNKPGQKREDFKKTSKFAKGQELVGTVKNFARAGAFISLPEDEEGFLPTSEEPDVGFANVMGNTSLEVGQEVKVRVLRIARGIVTLTMKTEEDAQEIDSTLNQGVVHTATNPFVVAFRRNKDIAAFLDERETVGEPSESASQPDSVVEVEDAVVEVEDAVNDVTEDKGVAASVENVVETISGDDNGDTLTKDDTVESSLTDISQNLNGEATIQDEDVEAKSEEVDSELTPVVDDLNSENADISTDVNTSEEVSITSQGDATVTEDKVDTPISETPQVADTQANDVSTIEDVSVEIVTNEAELETPIPEGDGSITDSNDSSAESETPIPEGNAKASISPALVKQLRDETGAGMMDCKKALAETGGDVGKAQEYLRKKGLASADKKSSRTTAEGRIGSYIHDSRIGVLIEVNCETDFVSRGDIFRELVEDLAMQVAAYPQVEYLSTEDVPKEIVDKETEIEMQKEDLLSKPEQFRSKIVEGRVNKRLGDLALLEQPYIKDDKVAVKDWVKQTIATIGENIKVRRFIRYNLGEGLTKKNQDFAAEVAAQTAAKSAPAPVKEEPAAVETEKPVEKAATVAVSAALVKQLREETGAGMMDCKKALSETGGDLEKAQEYLRKKGLSSAEKKSSRLAAEGRIGTYIHDARIGVLLEVNCETDFVGRSENFKELVDDLAMQVAACPLVQYVSVEDIPESIVSKEKEIEMQREDILSKPENIREKIVEGRISKRLGELALLEQAYIKNDGILVKDLVKQTVAALGENIKVRRFTRFTLGEQTESTNVESET